MTRARPPLLPVCVASRVKAAWRDSSAAALTLTAGRMVDFRGEREDDPAALWRMSIIERVARNAGEMGATTRRGNSDASSRVGDSVGRAVVEKTAAAFVPDASTGETCGDDNDDGLRANVRELSLPADGDDPAALPLRRD